MSRTQTLETKTLVNAMESRAKEYDTLRIQFRELRTSFRDIINLDDFKGKTAESVKGFYRAQIDVVDAWLDFIDMQEAFFKGVKGLANDVDLGEDTLVHLPYLDSDLKNSENRARQIVDGQEQALQDIFSGIEDIMSLEPYSTKRFDNHIDKATKDRKETKEKVESLDQTLVEHYEQSKYHENIIVGLISELYQASMQGGEVNPLYFNEDTYRNSDIHTAKEEAKKITAEYISWQDELEKARELENRSFGEKTWDTICTFTGEVTGYYDMKRATTGIDPVTGEELTGGQRATAAALAAAGFIPFVGWAGRAVKGGHAIYKTSKTFKAADNALDAYRTTEAFDILRKTEYGLYGLASANGFSEYITGKDMFGQELTEQQRQSSLTQSILVLAAGGGSVVVDRVQARNSVNHLFPTPTPPATNPGLRKPWNLEGAIQYVKDVTPRVRVVQDSLGNPHFMFMKGNGGGAGNTVKKVEPKKQDTVRPVESKGAGNKTNETPDSVIRDGSHMGSNGALKPNVKYQAGEYDYHYKTDELGRLTEFDAKDLKLTERETRLPHKSNTPGKEPGDHAGHLAADRFGGSPDLDNLVSQSSNVNLSTYKKLENKWAMAIAKGKDVSVNVKINYDGNSLRPSSFEIEYEIDGRMRFTSIEN